MPYFMVFVIERPPFLGLCHRKIPSSEMQETHAHSVANAAVYLPNWATLKLPAAARVKNLLGGWPKIGLLFIRRPKAALFSSNLPVSCQFREFLNLYNVQEHSFHQFQELRAISINHPLHAKVNNLIVFPPNWVKAPKFEKLGISLLDKNWATLKGLAVGKKSQFAGVWCSEVLATLHIHHFQCMSVPGI